LRGQIFIERSSSTGLGGRKAERLYLTLIFLFFLNPPASFAVLSTPYTVTAERELSKTPILPRPTANVYIPIGHIRVYKRMYVYGPPEGLAICRSKHIIVKPINVFVTSKIKGGAEVTKVSFRLEVKVEAQAQPGTYYAPIYFRKLPDGTTEAMEIRIVVTKKEYVPTHVKVEKAVRAVMGILALTFIGLVGLGVIGYLIVRFLRASEPLEEEDGEEEEIQPEDEEQDEKKMIE